MAGDLKVKMEAKLKVFPMKEMGKDVTAYMKKNPALQKKFERIEYSEKVELDKRKWTPKKLQDGLAAVARYELKLLAVRAAKMIKDGEKGDPKKLEKALTKEFEDIKSQILDKASLAIEEVVSDKGDNAKSLKDCKAAFGKLGDVDFANMYKGPRESMVVIFDNLAAALKDAGEQKDGGKAMFSSYLKDIEEITGDFERVGKAANTAIDTLLKAAKTTKADKSVDAELTAFAEKVLKNEGKFTSAVDKGKKFSDALEAAAKLMKAGKATEKDAKLQAAVFKKLSGLDGSGKDAISLARKLEPEFKKIEKKLK
ncbi:hypothetical protein EGN72_13395 [Pseudorhodobacter sp. E13]|uniref:hypothetical protein n=1 Tax=Pseudorhodobacter sp. E13 TaxID=2487931 RepID=UPI000F8F28C5|nr:hypothetical protein [Pseudorhodobacter sp. E13]RUS59687.1 hypothetical protein EGN72_13395 [Pseudorhodobacter sp. E13]